MERLRLSTIQYRILDSLYHSNRSAILEEFLKRDAKIFVFAGAIRDAIALLYEGRGANAPRDFDIGIAGISRRDFHDVLAAFGLRNRHGGFVLRDHDLPAWDVWRLEDSIGLRKTGNTFSLETVLKSFNLNCNAIALDIKTGMFIDAGAIESIRRMRVGFVEGAICHSHATFAAKALLVQLRFGYSMSVRMERFIDRHLEESTLLHESLKSFPALSVIPPMATSKSDS
jgi:hypothetical protein